MSLSNNYPTIKPSLLLDFSNTKQLDPRITFTRTSTATYYDGVTTAMAEQNLLTYSEQFDLWGNANISVTTNSVAAPNGTTTADTVVGVENTSVSHRTEQSFTTAANSAYTFSVYAKAATSNFVIVGMQGTSFGSSAASAWVATTVDLSTGTKTDSSGATAVAYSTVVTSVGSGWYRISITGTTNATSASSAFRIMLSDTATPTIANFFLYSYLNGTSSSVYLWGAQLENRSSVTAYTATTTQPITNYIPVLLTAAAGIPRFNHNPTTGESLGLLIEESRTNLLTYSEQFDNAAWTKAQTTVTANAIIAPDGTLTADLVSPTAVTLNHGVFRTVSVSAGAYTLSGYAKAQGASKVLLYGGATGYGFDLANGTMSAVTGITAAQAYSITAVGNGWYRCSITVSAAPTEATFLILETFASMSYAGNVNNGIYIWGAQLE